MKKKKAQEGEKRPEQKIVYIDDGSTVADMSGTRKQRAPKVKSTFREKMATFLAVAKKMVLPMLGTILALCVGYLILLLASGKLW